MIQRVNSYHNAEYCLWRIVFPTDNTDQFHKTLDNIKDNTNRLIRIDPGPFSSCIDVILTEEELSILKLSVAGLEYFWVQDWADGTLN